MKRRTFVLDGLNGVGMILSLCILFVGWASIPDRIPAHYGLYGADAGAPKSFVSSFCILYLFFYLLFWLIKWIGLAYIKGSDQKHSQDINLYFQRMMSSMQTCIVVYDLYFVLCMVQGKEPLMRFFWLGLCLIVCCLLRGIYRMSTFYQKGAL